MLVNVVDVEEQLKVLSKRVDGIEDVLKNVSGVFNNDIVVVDKINDKDNGDVVVSVVNNPNDKVDIITLNALIECVCKGFYGLSYSKQRLKKNKKIVDLVQLVLYDLIKNKRVVCSDTIIRFNALYPDCSLSDNQGMVNSLLDWMIKNYHVVKVDNGVYRDIAFNERKALKGKDDGE